MAKRIVQRQGGGDEGPVGPVGRQNAESGGIRKEARQVVQAAYRWIVYDGVGIVEVEGILKVVGINKTHP
jgi:hypothetical protein